MSEIIVDNFHIVCPYCGNDVVDVNYKKKVDEPPSPPVEHLRAVLTTQQDGKTFDFSQETAEDMGDYLGTHVKQQCFRSMVDGFPMTVFFRPDKDSDRNEVVFELGRAWGEANQLAKNPSLAYDVKIFKGDNLLAEYSIPKHIWGARWRWQSSPRPPVRKPSDLIDSKLIPEFDSYLTSKCDPSHAYTYENPFDNAGVTKGMPAGGDREDLGIFTECQGDYLATESPTALATLLAQAEAAGSVPWNLRDENTGAPINYYGNENVFLCNTEEGDYLNTQEVFMFNPKETDWHPELSHPPDLSYVPFLLTDDPYHLEELQFQATYGILGNPQGNKPGPICYNASTRGFAWTLRWVFHSAISTPTDVPKWLLPKSYWEQVLDANRKWFEETFVSRTGIAYELYRHVCDPYEYRIMGYQDDYFLVTLAHGIQLGYTDWRKSLEWKLGSRIAMCDGESGWDMRCPCPFVNVVIRPDGSICQNWKEACELYKAMPPTNGKKINWYNGEPIDDSKWAPYPTWVQTGSWQRIFTPLAALALAKLLGIEGADKAYSNIIPQAKSLVEDKLHPHKWSYRWAYASE